MATRSMWLRAGGAVAVLLASGAAHAGDVPGGVTVKITAVAKDDAFFRNRKELVGLVCAVPEEGLHDQGGKWVGGSMTCTDGQDYYFYKVAVEQGDFGIDPASIRPPAPPVAASSSPDGGWTAGERVRIQSISPEDAFVTNASTIVGQACTVKDAALHDQGDGYLGGSLVCDDGVDYYFYKVAVAGLDVTPTPALPPAAPVGAGVAPSAPAASAWPAGKMVKVVDLDPADALAATKAALVGRTCTVVESPLVETGGGFYAGRLFCDDGKSYQVFKAKVAAP